MRRPATSRKLAYAEEVDVRLLGDFLRQLDRLEERIRSLHERMAEDWDFCVRILAKDSEEGAELADLVKSELEASWDRMQEIAISSRPVQHIFSGAEVEAITRGPDFSPGRSRGHPTDG